MNNKRIKQIAMAIIAVLLLTACNTQAEPLTSESYTRGYSVYIEDRTSYFILGNPYLMAQPLPLPELMENERIGGFGFGVDAYQIVHPPGTAVYGRIMMTDVDDYIAIYIEHLAPIDTYFVLKLFINYEEVYFRVRGTSDYVTKFIFPLHGSYEVYIPVALNIDVPNENYTYRLTAAAFADPYSVLVVDEESALSYWREGLAFILDADLVFGSGGEISLTEIPYSASIERRENAFFAELTINQIFEGFETMEYAGNPGLFIQVNTGEEIKLAFYAHLHPSYGYDMTDYLIVALLDWQQISINNRSYLHVMVDNHHDFNRIVDHGVLTLPAINEPGIYAFTAFMISHPREAISLSNSFPGFPSNRILIEVVE